MSYKKTNSWLWKGKISRKRWSTLGVSGKQQKEVSKKNGGARGVEAANPSGGGGQEDKQHPQRVEGGRRTPRKGRDRGTILAQFVEAIKRQENGKGPHHKKKKKKIKIGM